MLSPYRPDGTQSQRYNLAPFQRFEIRLDGIDRSKGQLIPEIEGTGFYVEQTDYPAILSVVANADSIQQAIPAKNGLHSAGAFKGIFLTHPLLTSSLSPLKLSLVVFKGVTSFENNLNDPIAASWPPSRTILNTAIQINYGVHLPPGIRYIRRLAVNFNATTITGAFGTFFQLYQNTIAPVNGYTLNANGLAYANPNPAQFSMSATILGASGRVEARDIVVPTNAMELQFTVTGTGLGVPSSVECVMS